MASKNDDILLDADGEDLVKDGDFDIGDGTLDDCWCIFRLNQGAQKQHPLLGPNLTIKVNTPITVTDVKQLLNLHLRSDGKEPKKLDIIDGAIDFEI